MNTNDFVALLHEAREVARNFQAENGQLFPGVINYLNKAILNLEFAITNMGYDVTKLDLKD